MRKKLVATLLVAVLAAVSVCGLTACSVSMPKGDSVTADEWVKAFEKTLEVDNYTLKSSVEANVSLDGTVTESKKTYSIKGSTNINSKTTYLYDEKGNKAYSESSAKQKASGKEDGESMKVNAEQVSKQYYQFSENKDSNKTYWKAEYTLSKYSDDDRKTHQESYWSADETSRFASNLISSMFSETVFYESSADDATAKSIVTLYDKFTYSGGVYTATLYKKADIWEGVEETLECTVKVSINRSKNCVTGLSVTTKNNGNARKAGSYSIDYKYNAKSVYSLTDIDKTDVGKKYSGKIKKAVEKAQSEKADSENENA